MTGGGERRGSTRSSSERGLGTSERERPVEEPVEDAELDGVELEATLGEVAGARAGGEGGHRGRVRRRTARGPLVILGGAMLLAPRTFRRLCRARDLLREVGERGPSIREVAARVGLSPFHFIRQFEAVFGETPHQLRTRARLDRARHLLAFEERSVTDVCMEVGFASLGTFSALFARRVGAPPSEYRRRVRALVQVPAHLPEALYPGCLALIARLPPDAFRNFREAPAGDPGQAAAEGTTFTRGER